MMISQVSVGDKMLRKGCWWGGKVAETGFRDSAGLRLKLTLRHGNSNTESLSVSSVSISEVWFLLKEPPMEGKVIDRSMLVDRKEGELVLAAEDVKRSLTSTTGQEQREPRGSTILATVRESRLLFEFTRHAANSNHRSLCSEYPLQLRGLVSSPESKYQQRGSGE
jgi:hypothetical protein